MEKFKMRQDSIINVYFFITILIFCFVSTGGYIYGEQILPDPITFYISSNPIYIHFKLTIFILILLIIVNRGHFMVDIVSILLFFKIFISMVSLVYNPIAISFFGRISYHIISLIAYFIAIQFKSSKNEIIVKVMTIFAIIVSIQVIFTSLYYFNNMNIVINDELYKHYLRIPIAASNVIAAYLVPSFYLIAFNLKTKKHMKIILLSTVFVAVILTKSTGGIVVFITVFVLSKIILSKKNASLKMFFSLMTMMLYFIIVIANNTDVNLILNGRLDVYKFVINNWEQHMLFGSGMIYEGTFTGAHNIIFDTLNQSGIIGLLVLVTSFIIILKKMFHMKKDKDIQGFLFFIISFLIYSMGEVCYLNYVGDVLFWFLCGIGMNTVYREREIQEGSEQ